MDLTDSQLYQKKRLQRLRQHTWYLKKYNRRLKEGVCPKCGGKRTDHWIICETCKEKARAYSKTLPPQVTIKRESIATGDSAGKRVSATAVAVT